MLGIHSIGAIMVGVPEVGLSPPEAKELATAIVNVQQHYEMFVSPETMAWLNLAFVGAAIYGPRAMLVNARWKTERLKKEQTRQDGANVIRDVFTQQNGNPNPSPGMF